MSKDELKACAHCGGRDIEILHNQDSVNESSWYWIIGCVDCDAEFAACESEEEAVDKWNTRDTSAIEAAVLRRLANKKMTGRDGQDGPFYSFAPGARATIIAIADIIEQEGKP
jgi:Lar family restriction alleviation protein